MPINDGVKISDHLTAQMEECKPEETEEQKDVPEETEETEEQKDDEQK